MPKKNTAEQDNTEVADSDTLKLRLEEAKDSQPVVVVISGRPLGKSFALSNEKMVMGRDLAAEISLGESAISRKHTELQITDEGVRLKDLGSTNGTFVNDQKVDECLLHDGDLIRVGNSILKFLEEGQIENVHYKKMYDLATRDGLTGALNKKAILECVNEEFSRARKHGQALCLLFFDIDHFKQVNDTYGHPAGDFVLKEISNLIINKMIRQKDTLGRYGGEEFALTLPGTPLEIGVDVAERIRKTIEGNEFKFDDTVMPITISIGVVALDSTLKSADDMITAADSALYDAKKQGRNRVCVR